MGLTLELQRSWRDPSVAFRETRSLFEQAGVLVFQTTGIPVEEMRGFSIGETAPPVIVVNRGDAYAGRCFTLFHEFAHLALHETGICTLTEDHPRAKDMTRLETYCNRVAGAALVPKEAILALPAVRDRRGMAWDPSELDPLARVFQVSRQVIVRRLLILHRTNQPTYGRIYSLDSSVLIFAWHEAYPIESFATFWDRLETMLASHRALVSEEVYEEVGRKDDGLHDWMKPHEGLLIPHTDDVQAAVSRLLQSHPLLIKARKGRSGGDPFVIAVAMCHKGCVITQEGPGSIAAPRIPDVCQHYGIWCQPLRDLIREQGWRF